MLKNKDKDEFPVKKCSSRETAIFSDLVAIKSFYCTG